MNTTTLQALKDAKDDIKAAIEEQGITISSTKLVDYATYISLIASGASWEDEDWPDIDSIIVSKKASLGFSKAIIILFGAELSSFTLAVSGGTCLGCSNALTSDGTTYSAGNTVTYSGDYDFVSNTGLRTRWILLYTSTSTAGIGSLILGSIIPNAIKITFYNWTSGLMSGNASYLFNNSRSLLKIKYINCTITKFPLTTGLINLHTILFDNSTIKLADLTFNMGNGWEMPYKNLDSDTLLSLIDAVDKSYGGVTLQITKCPSIKGDWDLNGVSLASVWITGTSLLKSVYNINLSNATTMSAFDSHYIANYGLKNLTFTNSISNCDVYFSGCPNLSHTSLTNILSALEDLSSLSGTSNPAQYDSTIYTESDGSLWVRIFHHNSPNTNGYFSSSDTFTTGVYKDANRWFDVAVCNLTNFSNVGTWEFMYKQTLTSSSTIQYARWTLTSNPMTTTAVTGLTLNTTSPYTTTVYGLCRCASNTYLANSNSAGNWWAAVGCWTAYSGGIPGIVRNGSVLTTGYLDLYIRIDGYNFTTSVTHTCYLGTTNLNKLTTAEKAVATNKGWTLV